MICYFTIIVAKIMWNAQIIHIHARNHYGTKARHFRNVPNIMTHL